MNEVWWKDGWNILVNNSWPTLLEAGIISSGYHAFWEQFELPVVQLGWEWGELTTRGSSHENEHQEQIPVMF